MGDHPDHTLPNHHYYKMDVLILAAKWLVRHSSTVHSPNNSDDLCILLSSAFFFGCLFRFFKVCGSPLTCHFVLKTFLQTPHCSGYSELWILRWRRRVRSSLNVLSHCVHEKVFSMVCACAVQGHEFEENERLL